METLVYEKVGSFLSTEENIGLIELHRPDAMNSLNDTIITEFSDLLDEIEKDDEVRVVV
ncbi:MAG: enoyl-CoA hydratase/isomerase family protein, partial [Candidatus Hodarchaeales archaeon]